MKNNYLMLLLFLLVVSLSLSSLPVFSEENTKQEKIRTKWTETFRLKDFTLFPTILDDKSKLEEYKKVLAKNYKEHPSVFSAAVEYGLLLLDEGNLQEAKAVWDLAVKDFVGNPTPKVYKAWTNALNGDYVSSKNAWLPIAKEKLDTGVAGIGSAVWFAHYVDSVLGLYLVRDYLPQKDRDEVSGVLEPVSKHFFPGNPKLASISISEDLKSGDIKSAEDKVQKLLIANPEDSIVLTVAGITKLVSGDYKEAIKLFDKSEQINPNSPTNQIMKARTLLALNKKQDADKAFERAIQLDPVWEIEGAKKLKRLMDSESYLIRDSISSAK